MRSVLAVTLAALCWPAPASAERDLSLSIGMETAVLPEVDNFGSDGTAFGIYGRLAWQPKPPPYTNKYRGYTFRFGVTPELLYTRAWLTDGDERVVTGQVGVRLDLAMAQKRGGLLEITMKGGSWLALRTGSMLSDRNPGDGDAGRSLLPFGDGSVPMWSSAFGSYFLIGRTRLEFEFEFQNVRFDDADDEWHSGLAARIGLSGNI